ncbi:MAG: hypothetical protein QM760_16900 [Nibricoccus sp.]
MTREKLLLKLMSDDLRALHASALALEKDLHRLSQEIDSQEIDSLAGLIAQINCTGFGPIDAMLRKSGVSLASMSSQQQAAVLAGVLAEAGESVRLAESRRIGTANAVSVMRRAARYMEMYCTSMAESAARLRLTDLAEYLRRWAREWIGLELNLNSVAAGPKIRVTRRMSEPAFAA